MDKAFKVASAVLFVLWVVSALLWVKSFFFSDVANFVDRGGAGFVTLIRGRLVYSYQPMLPPNAPVFRVSRWTFNIRVPLETDDETGGNGLWLSRGHYFTSMSRERVWWSLPLWWVPVGMTLFNLPVLLCAYSLTGNTSGTCPECGTTIPQASRPV